MVQILKELPQLAIGIPLRRAIRITKNRIQYTREANAAVEGAFLAGATRVCVRDGHGGNKALIPELLDKEHYISKEAFGRLQGYGFDY